jgi:curved DNA-binding protein CbpA
MSEDILKHDWYKVLGCSIEDTAEQISKASRKLSLKYHPDKNPSKSAETMFLLCQKAKEVLLDTTSRLEYDTAVKKVSKRKVYDEQRKGKMDTTKKRMRDELEQRMKDAKRPPPTGQDQGHADSSASKRAREQDIHNIRKENMARMDSHHEDNLKRDDEFRRQVADATARRRQAASAGSADDLSMCLKVKWRKTDFSQSEDSVVGVFREYGHIESVQFGGSKGTSAVLVFSSTASVQKAIEAMDESSVYKVSRVEGEKSTVFSHVYDNSTSSGSGSSGKSVNGGGTAGADLADDSGLMSHIRRAVERDQLLRSMTDNSENNTEKEKSQPAQPAQPAFVFKAPAAAASNNPFSVAPASQLKQKENDILKLMMEASALKKKAAAAAAAVGPS